MSKLALAILLVVPLSGCFGGAPTAAIDIGILGLQEIVRGNPTPVPAQDCDDLLDLLRERAEREAAVSLYQSIEDIYYGPRFMDGMVMEMADDSAQAAPTAGRAADAEVTGTNNQEAGVDEADILKTDGEWTYVIDGEDLVILHSETIGDLEEHARIPLDAWGGQLLLEDRGTDDPADDRLVVITSGSGYVMYERMAVDSIDGESGFAPDYSPLSHVRVYSLQDRNDPVVIAEHAVEGSIAGARMVAGNAYVILHTWGQDIGLTTWAYPDGDALDDRGLDWKRYESMSRDAQKAIRLEIAEAAMADNRDILNQTTLEDFLPERLQGVGGLTVPVATDCQRVLATEDGTGRSVSTILSLDTRADAISSQTVQILGGHPIVYGAQDALVLAAPSQNDWWFFAQPTLREATNLHWFDLDGLDVTHRASGRIDGIVQDQFGIDVQDDRLRVATTTGTWGRWWLDEADIEPMMNHMVVLEEDGGELRETGRVGGIAPGERIWSARFTEDRAYIVTFEQIDPLWIIDLSRPDDPEILGELEIPGVSTYIHPLGKDALLTIGYGPGPDGLGLDWGRIQVSLFDISDPTDPQRAAVLDLSPGGDGWSWSQAVNEHKAFTYWGALGKLAVPLTTSLEERVQVDGRTYWRYENHIGLRLIDVDTDAMTLTAAGDVDQDTLLPGGDEYRYWGGDIQRSYFLGFPDTGEVSVYALSGLGMTAHGLLDLALQDSVAFLE